MTGVRDLPGGTGGPAAPYVPFEYALLRAVPRIDRGECANVGVVLYCQARDYLGTLLHVDEVRLRSLDPAVDVDAVRAALAGVEAVCAGRAVAGRAAGRSPRERFGWLTAPALDRRPGRARAQRPHPRPGRRPAPPARPPGPLIKE